MARQFPSALLYSPSISVQECRRYTCVHVGATAGSISAQELRRYTCVHAGATAPSISAQECRRYTCVHVGATAGSISAQECRRYTCVQAGATLSRPRSSGLSAFHPPNFPLPCPDFATENCCTCVAFSHILSNGCFSCTPPSP